jgi:hypothetical protein
MRLVRKSKVLPAEAIQSPNGCDEKAQGQATKGAPLGSLIKTSQP